MGRIVQDKEKRSAEREAEDLGVCMSSNVYGLSTRHSSQPLSMVQGGCDGVPTELALAPPSVTVVLAYGIKRKLTLCRMSEDIYIPVEGRHLSIAP